MLCCCLPLCFAALLLDAESRLAAQGASLRRILVEAGFTRQEIARLDPGDLARTTTSHAIAGGPRPIRAAAYYYGDEATGGFLPNDFWLILARAGAVRAAKIIVSDAGLDRSPGSLIRMHPTNDFLVVGGHWNPSSAPSVVIRLHDLKAVSWFSGWVLETVGNNKCVYAPSMVHFAPTHPSRVRLRDLSTGEDREIYPLKPETELWKRRVEYVRRLYQQWGDRLGNHHGDPEQFNLYVREARYLRARDTLVLVLNFGAGEERIGLRYQDGLQEVAVIYRPISAKPQAEEGPLEAVLKKYRAKDLDDLVRLLQ